MTDLWASASELAKAGLPGIPTTKAGIIFRAKAEKWVSRPRLGKGRGNEYPIAALPKAAREAILSRSAATDAPPATIVVVDTSRLTIAATMKATTGLADWQRRCMDARAAILMEVERLAGINGQEAAIREIVRRAAEGSMRPDLQSLVPHANAKSGKAGARTLSRRSIFRWKSESAQGGVTALAPREAAPPVSDVPLWAPALLKLYRTPTKRPLAAIMEDLPAALPEGVPLPSYGQVRRFLEKLSVVAREKGRHGPNGLLAFRTFKRRSTDGLQPLDVVSADGHSFKADVAHPVHGRPFRPEVCAVLDVATRYAFGWSSGLAESTEVVMDTIRCGVEALGQFAIFYTDNGAGFTSEALTDEMTGLLSRIGATPLNSLPGRAQARGKVERLQGSLWKRAARSLATYSGRDMDNEARRRVVKLVEADIRATGASPLLMSWSDFLSWAGDQVSAYNARPHTSLPKARDPQTGKLRHMSPAEALEAAKAKGWEPMMLAPAIVEDLFRPQFIRVAVRGEVKLPWGRYFSQELEGFGGEKVRVGYDIHDGSRVWIRTCGDGRLICIAQRDGNVIAEQPASAVEYSRQVRAKGRLRLLDHHADEARAELGPALIEMSADMPVEIWRQHAELEAEFARIGRGEPETSSSTTFDSPIPSDPDERFSLWCVVDEAIRAGAVVSDRDRRWHGTYQTLPEFGARMKLAADFGSAFPMSAAR